MLLLDIRIKLGCRALGICALDTRGDEISAQVSDEVPTGIDPTRLVRLLDRPGTPFRVTRDQRIHMRFRGPETVIAEALGLLDLLGPEQASGDARAGAGK